jgi:hypothetical protein
MSRAMRDFAASAPSAFDPTLDVPLYYQDMTAQDAAWWDFRVRPLHRAVNPPRADRGWFWSTLLPFAHLVQLSKRRFCRPLVIWAEDDDRQLLRVGMSIMIEHYPHLEAEDPSAAQFIWFISGADKEVFRDTFNMSHPPKLGRILLDIAMVLSENAGDEARIGLHAAHAGGDALLAIYQNLGLLSLPDQAPMPVGVRRGNDGRFFYTDPVTGGTLLQKLDPYR